MSKNNQKIMVLFARLLSVILNSICTLKTGPNLVSSKLECRETLNSLFKFNLQLLQLKKSHTRSSSKRNLLRLNLRLKRPTSPCPQILISPKLHSQLGKHYPLTILIPYSTMRSLLNRRLASPKPSKTVWSFNILEMDMSFKCTRKPLSTSLTPRSIVA